MSPRLVERAHRVCEPAFCRAEHAAAAAYAASEFWPTAHVAVMVVSILLLASGTIVLIVRIAGRQL